MHKLETRVLGQSKDLFASYLLCLNFFSIQFFTIHFQVPCQRSHTQVSLTEKKFLQNDALRIISNEIEVVKRCGEVSNVWKILSKEKRKKRSFSH